MIIISILSHIIANCFPAKAVFMIEVIHGRLDGGRRCMGTEGYWNICDIQGVRTETTDNLLKTPKLRGI